MVVVGLAQGQDGGDASVPPRIDPTPAPTGMKALPRRSPYISRYLRTAQGNAPEGIHYPIVGSFEVIVEVGIFNC